LTPVDPLASIGLEGTEIDAAAVQDLVYRYVAGEITFAQLVELSRTGPIADGKVAAPGS